MPEPGQSEKGAAAAPWSFDPTAGAPAAPYSLDLDPKLKLPPSYFMPPPGANGTSPATADIFKGQYDDGGGGGSKNPLDAAAGDIKKKLEHPGGSDVGINPGAKSVQYAPEGGILPGLFDNFQFRPIFDWIPGLGL
jgi:hypothetical protein